MQYNKTTKYDLKYDQSLITISNYILVSRRKIK